MNRNINDDTGRNKVKRRDQEDALKDALLSPSPARRRKENWGSARDELDQRRRLERKA